MIATLAPPPAVTEGDHPNPLGWSRWRPGTEAAQSQLGHASPTTTAGYARPSTEAAARMVAAMDQLTLTDSSRAVVP